MHVSFLDCWLLSEATCSLELRVQLILDWYGELTCHQTCHSRFSVGPSY